MMTIHPLSHSIPGFDLHSYHAGITAAFAEVVALGCKRLALSPPYTDRELAALIEPTRQIVQEHRLVMEVEHDLLITRLFPAASTTGRSVILIAAEPAVLDEYHTLKQLRASAIAERRLAAVEDELARRFGRLLSYSESAITTMLARDR